MKKRTKKTVAKICFLSMAFSVFSGFSGNGKAYADTWPDIDKAAIKSAQPHFSGYRVRDIETWSAETDPHSDLMRARVPLQKKNEAFQEIQANPGLHDRTEVMLMQADYGNSFFDSTVANNAYGNVAFNFWQYTDYFCPWHGAATVGTPRKLYDPANSDWRKRGFEFGIVNIPNQAYINAAHKNGVKAIACVYFDPAFRPGQTKDEMFEKDADGNFIVAKKLLELAKHYGFDGYFLNNEESDDERFKDFMAYLSANGMWTQFYDTNSSFDENKSQHLKDDKHAKIHDSVFVNYGWYGVRDFEKHAEKIGVDPYKSVFLGIEGNQGKYAKHYNSLVKDSYVSETDKNPRLSIALFTPSDMYQRGVDDLASKLGLEKQFPVHQRPEYQWMIAERERMYFSGVLCDPKNTGSKDGYKREDVLVNDASYWPGVADFKAESSVIGGNNFYSNFNIGKGMQYFEKGILVNDEPWTDLNDQDILPTWQWWFESSGKKLNADFDFGAKEIRNDIEGKPMTLPFKQIGAYHGGSSLAVFGKLEAKNILRLFKTDLAVTGTTKARLAFQKVSEDSAVMKLGLRFKDTPGTLTELPVEASDVKTDQFVEKEVDLSEYAGKTIVSIDLVFEGAADAYQMNVGQIAVSDRAGISEAPEGFKIEKIYDDGQMVFSWDIEDYNIVDKYRIYAESEGKIHFLGGIYNDRMYVKDHFFGKNKVVKFYLAKVGKDGQESAAALQEVNFNELPKNIMVEGREGAYGTEAKESGSLSVSFTAGKAGQHEVSVTPVYVSENIAKQSVTKVLENGTEAVVLPVAIKDGYEYDLTVKPVGAKAGISFRGRFHDSEALSLTENELLWAGYKKLSLRSPLTKDWKKVKVTFKAEGGTEEKEISEYERGVTPNYHAAVSLPSDKGEIYVTLTDYNGNRSRMTFPYDESFKKELFELKNKYSSVIKDPALAEIIYEKEGLSETLKEMEQGLKEAEAFEKSEVPSALSKTLAEQKKEVAAWGEKMKKIAGKLKANPNAVDFKFELVLPSIDYDMVELALRDEAGKAISPVTKGKDQGAQGVSLTYGFKLLKGKTYKYSVKYEDRFLAIEPIEKNILISGAGTEKVNVNKAPKSMTVIAKKGTTVKRGEAFHPDDYSVEIKYSENDKEMRPLTDSEFKVSPIDTETLGEKRITVSFRGKSAHHIFTVVPNDRDPKRLPALMEEVELSREIKEKADYKFAEEGVKKYFDKVLSEAEEILGKTKFDEKQVEKAIKELKRARLALDGRLHQPLVPKPSTSATDFVNEPYGLDNIIDGKEDTFALFVKEQEEGDVVTLTYPRKIRVKEVDIVYPENIKETLGYEADVTIQEGDIEVKDGDVWKVIGSIRGSEKTSVKPDREIATEAVRLKITKFARNVYAISEFKVKFVEDKPKRRIIEEEEEILGVPGKEKKTEEGKNNSKPDEKKEEKKTDTTTKVTPEASKKDGKKETAIEKLRKFKKFHPELKQEKIDRAIKTLKKEKIDSLIGLRKKLKTVLRQKKLLLKKKKGMSRKLFQKKLKMLHKRVKNLKSTEAVLKLMEK